MDEQQGGRWRGKIRRNVATAARLSPTFVIINLLATVVASYGLLANSSAVVIGAMLIATLLGPISGIALALVDANYTLLRKALTAEFAGALLVIVIAYLIGVIHRAVPLTPEILSRTHPNLLDLMIALGGGAAGGFATVNRRLNQGLVGTAIATALVPPLASCGICLAHGDMRLGWGAFLLFFANLVAIQFSSSVVLWLAGFHNLMRAGEARGKHVAQNLVSLAVLVTLGTVFALRFADTIARQTYAAEVRRKLTAALVAYPGARLADVAITEEAPKSIILAVVRTPYSLSPARVSLIEKQLPKIANLEVELHIQSILVKEVTRNGYLHETHEPEAPEENLSMPVGPNETTRASGGTPDDSTSEELVPER
jgi:uncharacterized hydrophobic protein (TIGR00271 family)